MSNVPDISLTGRAADHVRNFLAKSGGVGMRLGIKKSGCSGFAYEVGPAQSVEDDDIRFESRGITILVGRDVLPVVAGTEIDFEQQGLNRVFVFHNPNVTAECGCGESFTVASAA